MAFQWSKGIVSPHKVWRNLFLKAFQGRWGGGGGRGVNFWEETLLRGCSARGINYQIIMPRAGEFGLGEAASEYCL